MSANKEVFEMVSRVFYDHALKETKLIEKIAAIVVRIDHVLNAPIKDLNNPIINQNQNNE